MRLIRQDKIKNGTISKSAFQNPEGVSVFKKGPVSADEVLKNIGKPGDQVATLKHSDIKAGGMKVEPSPGDANLPKNMQDNHGDVRGARTQDKNLTNGEAKTLSEKATIDSNGC